MPVVAAMVKMTRSRSPVVEWTIQGYFYANLGGSTALSILSWLSLKFLSDMFSNL